MSARVFAALKRLTVICVLIVPCALASVFCLKCGLRYRGTFAEKQTACVLLDFAACLEENCDNRASEDVNVNASCYGGVALVNCGGICESCAPFLAENSKKVNVLAERRSETAEKDEEKTQDKSEAEDELLKAVDEFLAELDLSAFEKFFADYGKIYGEQKPLRQLLAEIASGQICADYSDFFVFLTSALALNLKSLAPALITVFCIALLYGVISSAGGGAKTSGVLFIACYCSAAGVLFAQLSALVSENARIIRELSSAADSVFPLLVTLLTLSGGSAQTGFFKPACAFITEGAIKTATDLLLPLVTASAGVSAASALSDKLSVKKTGALLSSVYGWVLGGTLAVFSLWMMTSGLAAKGYDGALTRLFKFAVAGGIPFVGGFAKDSVDVVLTGAALVKNAAGIVAIVCLFAAAASAVIKIAVFSLSLKLLAALCEPIADKRMSDAINSMSKSLSMLSGVVVFIFVAYFILLTSFIGAQTSVLV